MSAKSSAWATVNSTLLLYVAAVVFTGTACAGDQDRTFNIPTQPATTGIPEFARQARIQILVPADDVKGIQVNSIRGSMSTREALRQLLAGTGIAVASDDGETIVLTVRPADAHGANAVPAAGPAGQVPPAAALSTSDATGTVSHVPSEQARPGEQALEEVIVTARRRDESAQHVPVAITALTATDIEAKHITTAQDLQQSVPSLAVYSIGTRDGETYSLRGQGTTFGAAQAVVVYLNDVPLPTNPVSSANGGGPGLYIDLQNLVVLNGPQGTLFGKNTTGGAILIQPRKPTDQFEGYVRATYGNFNDQQYEGMLNVPLVDDKLLLRVVGQRQSRDGFTRNLTDGQDLDNRDNWSARATVSYAPSDSFQNDTMFYGTWSHTNGSGGLVTLVNPTGLANLVYSGLFGTPSLEQAFADQQARGIRATANDAPTMESTDYWGFIDTARWSVLEDIALKNIAAYQVITSSASFDSDGTALPIAASLSTANTKNLSEELQLQGKSFSNLLTWTLGTYWELIEPRGPQVLNSTSFGGTILAVTNNSSNGSKQRSRALYSQGTYDLGNLASALGGLNFTAGYRYTWDYRNDFTRAMTPAGFCLSGTPATDCLFSATQRSSAGTWTLGLDYQIDPRTMVYVKGSRGYKAGGFNLSSLDPSRTSFAPEYVRDVEIGLKRDWEFGAVKARTNIDAFHTDYTDIQKTVGIVYHNTPSSVTANVATARINGVEFTGTIVPTADVELSGSYSHLDARYTQSLLDPVTHLPLFDTRLPFDFTPADKFSIAATFHLPIRPGLGEWSLSANYAYTSKLFTASDFEPGDYIPGYGLLNATVEWAGAGGKPLDVSFFVTNATDTTYRIAGFSAYDSFGLSTGVFGEPRMFGARLRYRFGSDTVSTF